MCLLDQRHMCQTRFCHFVVRINILKHFAETVVGGVELEISNTVDPVIIPVQI